MYLCYGWKACEVGTCQQFEAPVSFGWGFGERSLVPALPGYGGEVWEVFDISTSHKVLLV